MFSSYFVLYLPYYSLILYVYSESRRIKHIILHIVREPEGFTIILYLTVQVIVTREREKRVLVTNIIISFKIMYLR